MRAFLDEYAKEQDINTMDVQSWYSHDLQGILAKPVKLYSLFFEILICKQTTTTNQNFSREAM